MSVTWTEYKGKRILDVDYRDLDPKEFIESLDLVVKTILEVPPPTKIISLTNLEGAVVNKEGMAKLKEMGPKVETRIEKSAIVGIHGIRHVLLSAYNRVTGASKHKQRLFNTREEALEWLVSDD